MDDARQDSIWASGSAYEPYVGRWSRLVAHEFLDWLGAPKGQTWVDVGCGTGALSETILAMTSPRHVVGVDASPGYAEYGRRMIRASNACFEVGDARALPIRDASYDAAVSGLALNFVPSPALEAELKEYVKRNLAPYKYPRWIGFTDQLPKTATGKIQRLKL